MSPYRRNKLLLFGWTTTWLAAVIQGFSVVPRYMSSRPTQLTAAASKDDDLTSFWKQRPGESDRAFYQRIQQAASSPQAFEQTVREHAPHTSKTVWKAPLTDIPGLDEEDWTTVTKASSALKDDGDDPPPIIKKGYQRVEEWEAEQQNKPKTSSWDEKVQFEGLRHGNQFQQNEILRHHLHTY